MLTENYYEQYVGLFEMKMAWYNSDVEQTRWKAASDNGTKLMYTSWFATYHRDATARERIRFDVIQWLNNKDQRMKAEQLGHEQTDEAPQVLGSFYAPTAHSRERARLENVIITDVSGVVQAHIDAAFIPAYETISTLEYYFSTEAVLRRYEWHLLETDKIWDTSQEALEALLVMNMNSTATVRGRQMKSKHIDT